MTQPDEMSRWPPVLHPVPGRPIRLIKGKRDAAADAVRLIQPCRRRISRGIRYYEAEICGAGGIIRAWIPVPCLRDQGLLPLSKQKVKMRRNKSLRKISLKR